VALVHHLHAMTRIHRHGQLRFKPNGIIQSQSREIDEMKAIMKRL